MWSARWSRKKNRDILSRRSTRISSEWVARWATRWVTRWVMRKIDTWRETRWRNRESLLEFSTQISSISSRWSSRWDQENRRENRRDWEKRSDLSVESLQISSKWRAREWACRRSRKSRRRTRERNSELSSWQLNEFSSFLNRRSRWSWIRLFRSNKLSSLLSSHFSLAHSMYFI